jgi:hypothetical protein
VLKGCHVAPAVEGREPAAFELVGPVRRVEERVVDLHHHPAGRPSSAATSFGFRPQTRADVMYVRSSALGVALAGAHPRPLERLRPAALDPVRVVDGPAGGVGEDPLARLAACGCSPLAAEKRLHRCLERDRPFRPRLRGRVTVQRPDAAHGATDFRPGPRRRRRLTSEVPRRLGWAGLLQL